MKRILVFLYLIPALGVSQPVTDGLVGYWPFNGNANDESSNGNNGIVNGAILTTDRFGNANSAYEFDGVDDYMDIGSIVNDLFGTTIGTWSIWLKPVDATPSIHEYPLSFGDTDQDNMILIGHLQSGSARFHIKKNGQNQFILDTDNIVFGDNTWVHVAVIQNGIEPIIYINGVAVAQSFSTTTNKSVWFSGLTSIDNGRIGELTKDNGNFGEFHGTIDDICIYNRVLSEQEIWGLYSNTQPQTVLCNSLYCDGENIGIGTSDTKGYRLAVAGNIITEEVKVALQSNWPDFVFQEDYKLNDLSNLENYIKTNKHLPNIPNAGFVAKEGYHLGEMDAKLLEKVEELTLYLIEHNKRIDRLERRNAELEKELKILKAD
ncbi:MAG: hypothetical protein MI975_06795 [Cytophagales bacterium]|nr:hypothetical protein [Cytophagales bacterium]